MTSHTKMATSKSKVEYLKRYGYKPEDSSKKRIKKVKKDTQQGKIAPKVKIVDDDIDINAVAPNENDDNDPEMGEDAPQIAGFVDERPVEIQKMELFASNKWRVLGDDQDGTKSSDANADNSPGIQILRHDSDSDGSVQNRRVHSDSDQDSLPRKRRNDSDASPPRQRARNDSDESPPRRKMSPNRRNDSDTSPPRSKTRRKSSASPLRRSRKYSSDTSPVRRKARHDSDSSPQRSKSRNESKPSRRRSPYPESDSHDQNHRYKSHTKIDDQSRRKKRSDSDSSPKRKSSKTLKSRHRSSSDSDQSYHRGKSKSLTKNSHHDQIPKKHSKAAASRQESSKSASHSHSSTSKNKTDGSESDPSPPRKIRGDSKLQKKTLDGKKAGLQDSKTLKLENEAAKERERRLFEKMGEEISGKNAKTILRDRSTGQRRNLEEEKRKQMEEDAIKAEREAKYHQWGKGLKQTELQKSRLEQDLQEISKPLARYKDDVDLDKVLREQDREGDPMLAFIKKKKSTQIGGKELPKYNGPQPPPNRFGIMPGYRWDGVDRSCGFEKSRFARLSNKVAAEEEAYKWSVEDM